jgi:acetyl esterase/lipase
MSESQPKAETREYGSWISPIGAEMMASSSLNLSDPRSFQGNTYWHESRPAEQGRGVIVCRDQSGMERDLIHAPYSARSGVHEYGGRCYTLGDNKVFFVNSADQQIYWFPIPADANQACSDTQPRRLTPEDKRRYADLEWSQKTNSILAVCEDHREAALDEKGEPETYIANMNFIGRPEEVEPTKLVSGADFYAYPRVSASGDELCWIEWKHPEMPWFSTRLFKATLGTEGVKNSQWVAGDDSEAIFQPEWHAEGALYFCSDKNNFWNLYRTSVMGVEQVSDFEGECGLPLWQFGMQTYAFSAQDKAVCGVCSKGVWSLQELDLNNGARQIIPTQSSAITHIGKTEDGVLLVAASPTGSAKILSLSSERELKEVKTASNLPIPVSTISLATAVEFETTDSMTANGFFYQPTNPNFVGPKADKPPLVVLCHGGPTAATTSALNLKVQFWTSRGFAVFDVNYRGSTGYGRQYRSLLDSEWGIYDVEDACAAARHACEQGWADPDKTIIRGSSAGGFTVLSALTFHNTFAAGGCLYGIGDLKVLAGETHKFEARYADSLIAPWPEGADEYDRRSPIYSIEKLDCPVIFFQGLMDKVVPPNQAEMMVDALDKKGLPVAYVTYAKEGHGFRSAEAISHSFNAELAFYGEVFGFKTDSSVKDLQIRNRAEKI